MGVQERGLRLASNTLALLALLAGIGAERAQAQEFTQDELRALPRICHAQKFISGALYSPLVPEAERKRWASELGPSYESFHHFCWALIYLRRASDPALTTFRQSNNQIAVNNFDYVLRNSTADFVLLPEVLLRKGMTLRLLGDDGNAAAAFLDAIRLKDDYTPAYSSLVDVYMDLGDLAAAREVLERGLKKAPNSTILSSKKLEIERREQSVRR